MRLLVDVNLSPDWLPILQAAGHDALHWTAIGPRNAPDTEIMARALEDNRVVFTHDLDFTAILAATGAKGPSVIQLREQDVDPTRMFDPMIDQTGRDRSKKTLSNKLGTDWERLKAMEDSDIDLS